MAFFSDFQTEADSSFFVTSHFSAYWEGQGFCRNNEVGNTGIKTSIACTGTCIYRIDYDQSCSRDTLKIMDFDPMVLGESGDDNACKSGNCLCGVCAENGKVPDGNHCEKDGECASDSSCDCPEGFLGLGSCLLCSGICKKKEGPGGRCQLDDNDECKFDNCLCGACTNSAGKHGNGLDCDSDGECTSGYCKGSTGVGCFGTCERKRNEGESCPELTGNDVAVSICYFFS